MWPFSFLFVLIYTILTTVPVKVSFGVLFFISIMSYPLKWTSSVRSFLFPFTSDPVDKSYWNYGLIPPIRGKISLIYPPDIQSQTDSMRTKYTGWPDRNRSLKVKFCIIIINVVLTDPTSDWLYRFGTQMIFMFVISLYHDTCGH